MPPDPLCTACTRSGATGAKASGTVLPDNAFRNLMMPCTDERATASRTFGSSSRAASSTLSWNATSRIVASNSFPLLPVLIAP